jgi:hypothetical protein
MTMIHEEASGGLYGMGSGMVSGKTTGGVERGSGE